MDSRVFGERLRSARMRAGMSQSALALASGVPKTRLSRYENNHILPSLATLSKITQALGISHCALLGEHDIHALLIDALVAEGVTIGSVDDVSRIARAAASALQMTDA